MVIRVGGARRPYPPTLPQWMIAEGHRAVDPPTRKRLHPPSQLTLGRKVGLVIRFPETPTATGTQPVIQTRARVKPGPLARVQGDDPAARS